METYLAPRGLHMSALTALALAIIPLTIINGARTDPYRARPEAASAVGAPVHEVTTAAVDHQKTPNGLSPSDWAGIRQAYERHRHQVVPIKGRPNHWRARNPGQQWLTGFDAHGFAVRPDSAAWTWGLTLQGYGRGETRREVGSTARVRAQDNRVTYHWDDTVEEWMVNDQRGLEHGFTVYERPAGDDGPLTLWLSVHGGLQPDVQADGRGVIFRDVNHKSALTYTGLTVVDADSHGVAAHFE